MKRISTKKRIKGRLAFVLFAFLSILSLIVGRVYYLETVHGEEYKNAAKIGQVTRYNDTIIPPNRGAIVDRNNQPIAVSDVVYNVAIDPGLMDELDKIEKENKAKGNKVKNVKDNTINILSTLLELDAQELRNSYEKDVTVKWKYIKKQVPKETKEAIEQAFKEAKLSQSMSVFFEKDTKRKYVLESSAANVIGFIRGDTSWGIERQYNQYMSGTAGRSFNKYNESGEAIHEDIDAIDGNTIVTTLDYTIQQFAEQAVKSAVEAYNPENAGVIVMNPKTGEVLAMAQAPTFNPNNPAEPLELSNPDFAAEWETKTENEKLEYLNNMWKNFNVSSTWEPGSIVKPMFAAAAIDENLINSNTQFYCPGYRQIADAKIGCHLRSGHQMLDTKGVLAQSCNVGAIQIGLTLGKSTFYKYQTDFGFGKRTGIDLPGEPSEADFSAVMYNDNTMSFVDLATMSMGQSFNATPIQSIVAFASLINGGNILKPYVVSQVVDQNGNIVRENKPTVLRKVISKETSDLIRKDLQDTLEVGTGKKAHIEGYAIGGKTGTGQQGRREDNIHSISFVTYFPIENPEILSIIVIHKVEDYEDGVTSPAPMMKQLMENIINYKGMSPIINEDGSMAETSNSKGKIEIKDFTNWDSQDAISELEYSGLDYEIVGNGNVVVNQVPHNGEMVIAGTKVLLYTTKGDNEGDTSKVPDVRGMDYTNAYDTLEQAGFKTTVDGESEGVVVSQKPLSSVFAEKGSDIVLKFEKPEEAQEEE